MINIQFSNNLKRLMYESSLNQVKLSKEIGIAQSAISAWLLDKKEPSITSLWLLADYFQCSVDELIGSTENIINSRTYKSQLFPKVPKKFSIKLSHAA